MRWYRKLYTSDEAHQKRRRLVSSVKKGKYVKDLYIITLCENGENLFDIVPGFIYLQPFYMEKDDLIVGLSIGKNNTLELIRQMVDEIYKKTGKIGVSEVREYFEKGM